MFLFCVGVVFGVVCSALVWVLKKVERYSLIALMVLVGMAPA